ncbi:hypothetical protein BCR34DRAFT_471435 [Clohesyomyces aquaticus]|uniref:Uncharacterized protein n=1 Tax=Clohesyomyces aquaticus TaxID=1231657 RepID=A0A1Y2AD16_9PLEO|nr:hypothetical protein BCR34DRAFT_471435 [Clohesyomyces aquaticus]
MTPSSTFAPHQPSPLARAISPCKDPRTPPCTPWNTAKLWDEYERRAVANAKRRDNRCSDTSYDSNSSSRIPAQRRNKSSVASPQFDFGFQTAIHPARRLDPATSTTVAICKTCKRSIPSVSGICERCKKTIVLSANPGELTPPLAHSRRNFASHSRSQSSTRPPSLSTITTPPQQTNTNYVYTRHTSATPSELSTLHPYVSNASTPATAPSSVCRASYNLQNTMSAWDWDSDDDGEERAGLVGYWKGKMWRGSRVSLAERDKSASASGSGRASFTDRNKGASISGSGSVGGRRESNSDQREPGKNEGKKKRGFVRVISCGCADEE